MLKQLPPSSPSVTKGGEYLMSTLIRVIKVDIKYSPPFVTEGEDRGSCLSIRQSTAGTGAAALLLRSYNSGELPSAIMSVRLLIQKSIRSAGDMGRERVWRVGNRDVTGGRLVIVELLDHVDGDPVKTGWGGGGGGVDGFRQGHVSIYTEQTTRRVNEELSLY